jgi:peptide deformylase
MEILERTQFGNPILRKITQAVKTQDILSEKVQRLIADMKYTLVEKKLGIGLAAPQVGEDVAIAVIAIRKSKTRPNAKDFDLVLINPVITETVGNRTQMWEGCISAGSNGKADLFAKVPRYKKIRVKYFDQHGKKHHEYYEGLQAHVIQHEVDHLNGILFVDRVKDTNTYMTYKEYLKNIKQVQK